MAKGKKPASKAKAEEISADDKMILVPVKLFAQMNRVAHNTQARKILLKRQNELAKGKK